MRRHLSLRARLLLAVVALAAVGLLAADVATYSALRSFLMQRTDASLAVAHAAVRDAVFHHPGRGPHDGGPHGGGGDPSAGAPDIGPLTTSAPGEWVALLRLDGSVVGQGSSPRFPGSTPDPPPLLPSKIALPNAPSGAERVAYFTVPARGGSGRYRVRASIEPDSKRYVLVVAQSLNDVDSTLRHLLLVALLVTLLVLAGLAVLGLWVVRLGLRPLEAIGMTAQTIAAGDLSRRVEHANGRTEVGRLGLALNAMLGQIESAAHTREASLRALEASERTLRRFVADASHELRTPLAAVRAYAELFSRGAADRPDDLRRSMAGIRRESERMSLLVDDLLLLARLDEDRPLAREPVELADVLGDAIETARAVDPARPIQLELEPAHVTGDRERLRQVVDNLLANVRAHTPAAAPLRVTLRCADGFARLEVADSGPGLDADQVQHVFERFYRVDESRTRASGGAGLGLSIVAAVTSAHGGRFSVGSEPGQGATFVVELPLAF